MQYYIRQIYFKISFLANFSMTSLPSESSISMGNSSMHVTLFTRKNTPHFRRTFVKYGVLIDKSNASRGYLIVITAVPVRSFRLPRGIAVGQNSRGVTRECDEREHGKHLLHSYRTSRNHNASSSRHRDSLPPIHLSA